MPKRNRTAAERRYHDRIAQMGCLLCDLLGQGPTQASLHHIREGQGLSQRASHWLVVPLCRECHQGRDGIHGTRALLRIAKVEELDLLAMTIERMEVMR